MPKSYHTEPPHIIENKIARYILLGLAVGAGTVIFLSSPYGLYFLVRGAVKYGFRKRKFEQEMRRLERQGFIAVTKTKKGWAVKLLDKGKKRLEKIEWDDLKLTPSESWDKKWRLFFFDVPEPAKLERDLLTKKLKDIGMFHIQRSVFVYPYDCRKELEFISEHYGIVEHTTYAEVSGIDIEKQLKRHFKKIIK